MKATAKRTVAVRPDNASVMDSVNETPFPPFGNGVLSNRPAELADGLELESTLSLLQDFAPVTLGPPLRREESHDELGDSRLA